MDLLRQVADWLRALFASQPWLDALKPTIAQTPDWALVAAGPGFFLLLALMLFALAPQMPAKTKPSIPSATRSEARKTPTAIAFANMHKTRADDDSATPTIAPQMLAASTRRASGVPNENEQERKARVFISSTFRDMRVERGALVPAHDDNVGTALPRVEQ